MRGTKKGLTPLHDAILNNSIPYHIINVLLSAGADIYARTYNGITPVMLAREINDPIILQLLGMSDVP